MTAEPGAGRHLGDNAQFDRDRCQIVGAYRISVHRRDREGRLRSACHDVLGEDAAEPVDQRNLLRRQRLERF